MSLLFTAQNLVFFVSLFLRKPLRPTYVSVFSLNLCFSLKVRSETTKWRYLRNHEMYTSHSMGGVIHVLWPVRVYPAAF